MQNETDAVLCIFPADHVIRDVKNFHGRLKTAIKLAQQGHVVTFGIKPGYPETGYGYIEGEQPLAEDALTIKRFVEKPDKKNAERYLKAGNFFWNSGMFAFKASVILAEFKRLQPKLFQQMKKLVDEDRLNHKTYERLPNISIDYAVMEKTRKGAVLPSDFGWSDIGSWKSLYDFLPKDKQGNVIDGDVIAKHTQNSFIMGHDRLIATNRLEDMVVVETPDSIFVSDIDNSRDVKAIVAELKQKGRREYHTHRTSYFPWGSRTVLEKKDGYQVDRIVVYPHAVYETLSETVSAGQVVLVEGTIKFTVGRRRRTLKRGESISMSEHPGLKFENPGRKPALLVYIRIALP
jgi:mannose-1-phosphate guanylyltransferase/mannose-6-phosphate isomerase